MKRREFLRTASAAAASPMLPFSGARSANAALYGKAVAAANSWAYMTIGNLKLALGVDDATGNELIDQLHADGILGETGVNGVAVSRKFLAENTKVVSATTKTVARVGGLKTAQVPNESYLKPQSGPANDSAPIKDNMPNEARGSDEVQEPVHLDDVSDDVAPESEDEARLSEPLEGEDRVEPAKREGV